MISYLEYIKLLEEKNMQLYDYQKRISYYKLKQHNQKGGKTIDIRKIKYLEPHNIEKVLIHLLSNNITCANQIIKNLCN